MLPRKLLHPGCEIVLQVLDVHALTLGQGLALGAFLPTGSRGLVAADVDFLGGEDVHDLLQHVLAELIGLLIAKAQHLVAHAPHAPHLVGAARAAHVGIGSQGTEHVAGHVDLGDYGDVSLRGVAHDLTRLVLCVVASVGNTVIDSRVAPQHGHAALGAHLGQPRVFLDFDAPALVVGDVPVEGVHIMESHQVDILLHEAQGEVVARAVEHHAAIAEPGRVADADGGQLYLGHAGLQALAQGLDGVEHTSGSLAAEGDTLVADRDAVALLLPDFLVKCELDVSLTVDDIELDARVFPHIVAQELSVTPQGGVVA